MEMLVVDRLISWPVGQSETTRVDLLNRWPVGRLARESRTAGYDSDDLRRCWRIRIRPPRSLATSDLLSESS